MSISSCKKKDDIKTKVSGENITQVKRKAEAHSKEMKKLVDKMMMEIRIIDTDEDRPDTVRSIIRRALANKGIFTPFEFSIRKIFKGKDDTLMQSEGFNGTGEIYRSDLSLNRVFNTHHFLFLQLSGKTSYILAGMKGSLLLSLLFSLIMIGAFFYTLRLIHSQKKITEIRNDFVNNMTHELKTPIATISLAVEAINNPMVKNNEAMFNDYRRILKEENDKLGHHVDRVLQISLIDQGRLVLDIKRVNLSELLNSCIMAYRLKIAEKNATVNFSPPHEIFIDGDEEHLRSAFGNLIDNALKYSDENCRIELETIENETEVKIMIRDNGIGINDEHNEKIFDKFYRVQGGNLHDVKGFGLGLSYVRSIIEAHEGTIKVKSALGKGSEFTITLKKHV